MIRIGTTKLARRLALGMTLLAAGVIAPVMGRAASATFYVGVGERDISPTTAELETNNFFLGGYGFGSGRAGTQDHYVQAPTGDRHAVGVMGDNLASNPFAPWVRAFAIGDGTHTIVLTDFDNQGTFASYKPNVSSGALRPYALDDIRAAAAAQAAADGLPGLEARSIVLSSDHSHAGQDLTGVWGFVPDAYLARVKALAVDAIVDAYRGMQPAILKQSAIETPQPCGPNGGSDTRIFSNQFCGGSTLGAVDDHANDLVDAQVRVLRAFHPSDPDGNPFAILVNAAIHATVGGSGNRYVSSDWVSTLANYIQGDTGAKTVTIVGDVGRTQPADRACDASNGPLYLEPLSQTLVPYDADPRQPGDSCAMSQFARRVQAWVNKAIADTEQPIASGGVDYRELFIRDASDSAILFGANYGGDLAGIPITRGITPPYLNGTVIGTWVGAYRVGDVLMVSAPGEAYPNIRDGLIASVKTSKPVWIFGLANDQLGYLIAPTPEGYPEPIRRSFADGDPHNPATWSVSPIDNDNFFFNVSPTIGDHVMCTMIKGALQLGFMPGGGQPAKCGLWMAEPNESGPGDPTWKAPA